LLILYGVSTVSTGGKDMKHRSILFLFCMGLVASCSDEPASRESMSALSVLRPVDGCDALLASLKARAIEDMERQVDQGLKTVLEGSYCWDYRGDGAWLNGVEEGDADYAVPSSSGGESASQYSETNTQVAGVDEADFVKNDGGAIYILADGQLKIIDAWPPEEARVLSAVPIEGEPKKLFVYSGRALVYSSLDPSGGTTGGYYGWGECTYGYDCDFTGDGHPLKMTLFDISDPTSPVLLRESRLSGSYINSRRIDGAVYTVVSFPEISFPGISTWPEGVPEYCPGELSSIFLKGLIRAMFEDLKAKNRAVIQGTVITDWLPGLTDTVYADGVPATSENLLGSCDGFYESGMTDGKSLVGIVSMAMDALDPLKTTTIVGRPGAVYASRDALYVASRHQAGYGGWSYDYDATVEQASSVHKFALLSGTAEAAYLASGVVKGNVLNQFSMDEKDGFLRIATTTGHVPDPNVHSTVSVLAGSGGSLKIVGQVDHIAPTEDIRSARFSGDKGFIVTFKKTDPLFVLDMSDPRNPRIAGELKIPGYSTYMHLMDDTHILSIGYDADDEGSFAWFQGIQLQIFDIADMTSPTLTFKEVIGTRGSTSDATTNHLAFNYFPPKDVLAIPMIICEGGSGGTYGDLMTFSGLLVYRVTVEEGFSLLGGISHEEPETPETYHYACGNWWTDSNSKVKRSIIMDDYVFSVAEDLIKISTLADVGAVIASIPLLDETE
jgi:hypothetical protein